MRTVAQLVSALPENLGVCQRSDGVLWEHEGGGSNPLSQTKQFARRIHETTAPKPNMDGQLPRGIGVMAMNEMVYASVEH